MWIVRLALRRPYTFIVMAALLVVGGVTAVRTSSTDIFPDIDIPVVTVIWTYSGLSPREMERQITQLSEFSISNTVSDVKRIESQTRPGVAVIRIFFHPRANIAQAIAQVSATSQTITRRMPPGTNPPMVLRFNASSVPVLQLAVSGENHTEGQLYDYGRLRVRQAVVTVPGATLPVPYGGAARQIQVDLDPQALQARGLSPVDVANAISAQNLTLPSGTAKVAETEYSVSLNSSPDAIAALNDVPIRKIDGTMVHVRDVAHVRDGVAPQTNIVRRDGQRSVLLTILKSGGASTIDIVENIKGLLPALRATAPPGLQIEPLFDQSVFVSAAVSNVLHEAVIVSLLVGALVFVFLGSWRSTLIVLATIPLSLLASVIVLRLLGHSLNVMTLGGLALAIGILVDDATVAVENIHRHLAMGKSLREGIIDGAAEIAVPTFVSTLCICIVFVSVVFLEGPARYLFVPMALAVVFAVFASYLLSRTLIPVLVQYLVRDGHAENHETSGQPPSGVVAGLIHRFNRGFNAVSALYVSALQWVLLHRQAVLAFAAVIFVGAGLALPFVGRDFFPSVDAGQFRLHIAAPTSTRIEETEKLFGEIQQAVRRVIPASEIRLVVDNIGQPDPINLGFTDSTTIGGHDGEMLVALAPKRERRASTQHYIAQLREVLPREFPGVTFYFMPGDIVSQILNFGLPQPIEVRLSGQNTAALYPLAREMESRLKRIAGAVDVHLYQPQDAASLRIQVDRSRAAELGLAQRDVANSVLLHLSGSGQTSPSYWADPRTGINYPVVVQTPQHRIASVDALMGAPVLGSTAQAGRHGQVLANVASLERREAPGLISHTNVQPTFTVYASVQGRDLGSVAKEVNQVVAEFHAKLPPGARLEVAGQVASMQLAFSRLLLGLLFAALLVYFLMVVNFQSWVDPLIVFAALPVALSGVVWILLLTGTTFNVPSLMGTIMSIGVATANAILVLSFARQRLEEGEGALQAAIDAGRTRFRPVLMTAGAMILGMVPMALALGEGGEQNAPLARAAIGGLMFATVATLFLVPLVFSVLRFRKPAAAPAADAAAEHNLLTTS